MEFECVENDIDGVTVDVVATYDHENVVERSVRTVNERIRSMVQNIPCTCVSLIVMKRLVQVAITFLNQFPVKESV